MTDRGEGKRGDEGFTVTDGVALVAGAAVAAVHLRVVSRGEGFGAGWLLVWPMFLWLGLTAAGPFLYAVRHYGRGAVRRPGVGERLWALMGTPWVLTALVQEPPVPDAGSAGPAAFAVTLGAAVLVVCLVALATVWATWVAVPPDRASAAFEGHWTNMVGLLLAIAWPFQCGLVMVVIG